MITAVYKYTAQLWQRDRATHNTVFASFYVEGIAGGNVSSRRF